MNSLINKCFKLESKSLNLNYSGSRKIKSVLDSVYPSVKITIRLVAVDHCCYVEMSKDSLCSVMKHASEAISAMRREDETEIYKNDSINVFTECMHDKCAVCFVDHRGVRVNMMIKTFKSILNQFYEILNEYNNIYSSINSKAGNFKFIVDLIFNKMEQTQLDNEEFKKFVTEIKQYIDSLSKLKAPNETISDISSGDYLYDSDGEDDFISRRSKRKCTCYW